MCIPPIISRCLLEKARPSIPLSLKRRESVEWECTGNVQLSKRKQLLSLYLLYLWFKRGILPYYRRQIFVFVRWQQTTAVQMVVPFKRFFLLLLLGRARWLPFLVTANSGIDTGKTANNYTALLYSFAHIPVRDRVALRATFVGANEQRVSGGLAKPKMSANST